MLGKHLLKSLVKHIRKFAFLGTETSSKVCESKFYNKAIINSVYKNR